MDTTAVFAPITKSYEQDDGSIMVEGIITDSSLDLDQQRCDPEWLKKAVPQWFSVGNLREQHDSHRAVGKAVEHQDLGDDGHFIRGRVVDSEAVKKVKAGVFTGFSIGIKGPRITKSADAPGGVIADGRIVEVSLVDVPCNGNATLTVCKSAKPGMNIKAADFDSDRMLVRVEELTEKAAEPEVEKEMTVSIAEQLAPEQVEQLEAAAEETVEEKAAEPEVEKGAGCGCCDQCAMPAEKSFDADAAKALVAATLAKADDMPPEYADEQGDIENAQSAISIISQLIVSEANHMVENPAEDCDIQLLLSAVSALRCFIGREQQQAMGEDVVNKPEPVVALAAEAEVEKAKYSAEELRQMLKDGKAFKNPDGDPSYPIADKEDLENAIHAVGRGSGDHDAIRAYIVRRAKALGASDMLPDSWTAKAVEPEEEKTVESEEVVEKAAVAEPVDIEKAIAAAIEKAFSTEVLEKEDNPIRKTFAAVVEASTGAVQKSVSDLAERLATVEQMAVPGGPVLRRTENERKQSRINDLQAEVMRYKALSNSTEDQVLRKGYAQKAAALEAEIKAL